MSCYQLGRGVCSQCVVGHILYGSYVISVCYFLGEKYANICQLLIIMMK